MPANSRRRLVPGASSPNLQQDLHSHATRLWVHISLLQATRSGHDGLWRRLILLNLLLTHAVDQIGHWEVIYSGLQCSYGR